MEIEKYRIDRGVYFVSGIDTDAGKTYMTGMLAKSLLDKGVNVITHKFIQTGGQREDIAKHREIMGVGLLAEDEDFTTCPVLFDYPASPHFAAQLEQKSIDFDAINQSIDTLANRYDVVLVEGAGGLHVPLEGLYTTIDYVAQNNLPLIFVTSGKLGSINHTLLSLEVCRHRGVEVHTVIYNRFFGKDKLIDNDTFNYIREYLNKYHKETQLIEF